MDGNKTTTEQNDKIVKITEITVTFDNVPIADNIGQVVIIWPAPVSELDNWFLVGIPGTNPD